MSDNLIEISLENVIIGDKFRMFQGIINDESTLSSFYAIKGFN